MNPECRTHSVLALLAIREGDSRTAARELEIARSNARTVKPSWGAGAVFASDSAAAGPLLRAACVLHTDPAEAEKIVSALVHRPEP